MFELTIGSLHPHITQVEDRSPVAAASFEDVLALHAELAELYTEGGSSNDFAQVVDDWFTQHGFHTIIYR